MSSHHPLALIVVGATASGKTALSIELAKHFNTSIISADSRQCFREMTIGTAKPTPEELSQIKHYFINSHSIQDHVDAAVFEKYALEKSAQIFENNPVAIITGGTGLYMKSFCEGIDEMPAIDPKIRNHLKEKFSEYGISYLQEQLSQLDPDFLKSSSETLNPSRLIRALEVKMQTGMSILDYRKGESKPRPFRIVKLGIDWPRDMIYERIDSRVDDMVNQGLLKEVASLVTYKNNQALQTVGYEELFEYMEGKTSFEDAVKKIKQHTRNYAKRQMTWFRKDEEIHWFQYNQLGEVIPFVKTVI